MQLTRNFTKAEMEFSATGTRKGLVNVCPADLVPNIVRVATALEQIRAAWYNTHINVLSCYRSPAVNKAVGGSATSAHKMALAADFRVIGVDNIEVCRWIEKHIEGYDQCLYEFGKTGWIHLGFTDKEPRKQCLSAYRNEAGKTVYVDGFVA